MNISDITDGLQSLILAGDRSTGRRGFCNRGFEGKEKIEESEEKWKRMRTRRGETDEEDKRVRQRMSMMMRVRGPT